MTACILHAIQLGIATTMTKSTEQMLCNTLGLAISLWICKRGETATLLEGDSPAQSVAAGRRGGTCQVGEVEVGLKGKDQEQGRYGSTHGLAWCSSLIAARQADATASDLLAKGQPTALVTGLLPGK